MKNKIILIVLIILLSMPSFVFAIDDIVTPGTEAVLVEDVQEDSVAGDAYNDDTQLLTNEEKTLSDLPYKKPISKRSLLKKFLLAMFLVGLSPVIIYFGLVMYKRINEGKKIQVKTLEGDTSLSAPTDIETATRVFLDKTEWR